MITYRFRLLYILYLRKANRFEKPDWKPRYIRFQGLLINLHFSKKMTLRPSRLDRIPSSCSWSLNAFINKFQDQSANLTSYDVFLRGFLKLHICPLALKSGILGFLYVSNTKKNLTVYTRGPTGRISSKILIYQN